LTLLVFMAAVEESTWHIAGMCARGREPRMLCGHRLRGPVHRLFATVDSAVPPAEVCAACWSGLLGGREPDPPTGRHALGAVPDRDGVLAHRTSQHPCGRSELPWPGILDSGLLSGDDTW